MCVRVNVYSSQPTRSPHSPHADQQQPRVIRRGLEEVSNPVSGDFSYETVLDSGSDSIRAQLEAEFLLTQGLEILENTPAEEEG